MSEPTNEQKLYVLLYGTYNKTEQEKTIWCIIKDRYSKDSSWFVDVAKNLKTDNYASYSCGTESGSRWTTTDLGRRQIPILWNGSTLKKEYEEKMKALKKESSFEVRHKKINKFLWILLTAIVSSLVTIIVSKLLSLLCKK